MNSKRPKTNTTQKKASKSIKKTIPKIREFPVKLLFRVNGDQTYYYIYHYSTPTSSQRRSIQLGSAMSVTLQNREKVKVSIKRAKKGDKDLSVGLEINSSK